jgi:hypothetical protein
MAQLALQALKNPKIQQMVAEKGAKLLQQNINKLPRARQSQEEEDEEEEVIKKPKKKKGKKKKKDDEEEEEEEEEEEDEDAKVERIEREKEAKLSQVNTKVSKFYNIDKENALKFKKAYYERRDDGMIDMFDVYIEYNGVKAKIFKIKKSKNKIFSIKIMAGTESTEIPRRQIMIDGHPVDNRSIINKIVEVCVKKEKE